MDLTGVTDPYLATAGISGDTVVAKVGGTDISAAELLYWINYGTDMYLRQFGGAVTQLPWDAEVSEGLTMGDQMKESALDAAAFYALLPEKAQKEGISVSPEVDRAVLDQLAQLGQQVGSDQLVDHVLWAQLLTRDMFLLLNQRADLHAQLQDLWFGEGSDSYPTDAEVLAYAQDDLGCFRVKHILLMTVDQRSNEPLDDAAIAQKKAQAEDLLAQLQSADDPVALFDQLMDEYSEDGGLTANPDGYVFDSSSSLVGGFREAALALQVGEISGIVETDYGYHIMLRLPLDPADYRDALVAQRMQARTDQWLEDAGLETTDAYAQLDMAAFQEKVGSLQSAISAEVQAASDQ